MSSISSKDAGAVKWWRLALGQQAHLHAQPPLPHLHGIVHVLRTCLMLHVGTWAARCPDDPTLPSAGIWQKNISLLFLLLSSFFHIFWCYSPSFFKKSVLSSNLQRAHISTPQSPGVLALKKWLLLKVFGTTFQPVEQSTVSN